MGTSHTGNSTSHDGVATIIMVGTSHTGDSVSRDGVATNHDEH